MIHLAYSAHSSRDTAFVPTLIFPDQSEGYLHYNLSNGSYEVTDNLLWAEQWFREYMCFNIEPIEDSTDPRLNWEIKGLGHKYYRLADLLANGYQLKYTEIRAVKV